MQNAMILMIGQTDPAPSDSRSGTNGPPVTTGNGGVEIGDGTVETQSNEQVTTNEGGGGGGLEGSSMLLMILLFIVIMYVFIFGSQRKEKKKRAAMLEALKKNDKVVTIGGIMGTVVEVKASEVVLKVDESSNTRLKFARTAIQSVVSDEADKSASDNKNNNDKK